jgi:sucrose-6-phosphate hydrolase SacC (GH32 family)
MVAIYTVHQNNESNQSQHIAYSLDEGLTWTKYADNPVLDLGMKDFRDPKVTWDSDNNHWLMTVAKPKEFKIAFFTSPDLKNWEHLSDFGPLGATGGVWECPDLHALTTPSGEVKWVLLVSLNPGGITGGSGTQYFIGDWDGKTFTTNQTSTLWIDYGRDNYAGVTFNHAPDNRKIFLGWMCNWDYAAKLPSPIWRTSMTTPRELALLEVGGEGARAVQGD